MALILSDSQSSHLPLNVFPRNLRHAESDLLLLVLLLLWSSRSIVCCCIVLTYLLLDGLISPLSRRERTFKGHVVYLRGRQSKEESSNLRPTPSFNPVVSVRTVSKVLYPFNLCHRFSDIFFTPFDTVLVNMNGANPCKKAANESSSSLDDSFHAFFACFHQLIFESCK